MSLEAVQDGDDDLFVVIIGDEDENAQEQDLDMTNQVLNIKKEVNDEENAEMGIEELLETVEKHGQMMDIDIGRIKTEVDDNSTDCEYLDDDNDTDFVPNSIDENSETGDELAENEPVEKRKPVQKRKLRRYMPGEIIRYKMRRPEERKSFVKEIQQQFPELEDDKELLIETLSRIMLEVKRPKPPTDYFIMNEDKFECVICSATTDTIPASERHYQEKHGPRYLICYACGVDFRSTTNLYKHEKRCNAPDAVTVLKARAQTLGRKGRGRPFLLTKEAISKIKKAQAKAKPEFPCTQCAAVYRSRQSLQAHLFAHSGERPYRCALCPAAYTSSVGLSKHSNKHKDIQFICDHCSRPFRTKSALIVHLDTHRPLPRFECKYCGKRYAQKLAMTLHIDRDHFNLPPPHACQICPQRFPRMSILKTHMLKKHGMNLITRKMFFKALPQLSNSQISQAKVVKKSDLNECFQRREVLSTDIATTEPEPDLSQELQEYIKNVELGGPETGTKFIVIQDGEAICVDGSNINHFKHNLITELENDLNNLVENEHETLPIEYEANEDKKVPNEYEEEENRRVNIEILIDNLNENIASESENAVAGDEEAKTVTEYKNSAKDILITIPKNKNKPKGIKVAAKQLGTEIKMEPFKEQVISETKNVVAIKNGVSPQLKTSPRSKKVKLRETYKSIMKRK